MPAFFARMDDLGGIIFAGTRFRPRQAISELQARVPWRGRAVPIPASHLRRYRSSRNRASSPRRPRRRISPRRVRAPADPKRRRPKAQSYLVARCHIQSANSLGGSKCPAIGVNSAQAFQPRPGKTPRDVAFLTSRAAIRDASAIPPESGMSACGIKRTFAHVAVTSAFDP